MARLTPVVAAARLVGRRGRVLLHSARDDDGCGRYSFVACEPAVTLEARGRQIVVRDAAGEIRERYEGDPFERLAALCDEFDGAPAADRDGASSRSAAAPVPVAIGYLGYDLGRIIEQLPAGPSLGDDVPDLWFGFYGAVARFDRGGACEIVGADGVARGRLAAALNAGPDAPGPAPRLGPLRSDTDLAGYRAQVQRILAYILAGDVYQVNLARRLVASIERAGDALAIHAALLECAPAGFGAVLETDAADIVSGSPERFLMRPPAGSRLETRPIKGTRKRSGDAARDRVVAAELRADPKERAEHLMIVDLERNDLGRVAELGSVIVDDFAYVVELPTLYHLVSTVSCRVRAGVGLAEILRATFPSGSITGAPKIRAMQIIDELEPARRGPYTGAIGYIGQGGAIDLSIAIRTAVVASGQLRLHVGGGIVADSTPERELEETEEKAAAWRVALSAPATG